MITVQVDISHPFVGDLEVALVSPQGKKAILHNRRGGATDNIKSAFNSLDTPSLQPLLGEPARGEWALNARDLAFRDTGRLNGWKLELVMEE